MLSIKKVKVVAVFLIATTLSAEWIINEIPTNIENAAIFGIEIGDGRNDGKNRLYICSQSCVWEWSYSNGSWSCDTVTTRGSRDIAIGDARNDGINRVYINGLYEYTYNNGVWEELQVGDVSGWDICIAKGRNTDLFYLYVGGKEFSWNGTNWEENVIEERALSTMTLGKGRGDDTIRIYGEDSEYLYEWTWNGSSYGNKTRLDFIGWCRWVRIGDVRGDGKNRVYRGGREYTYDGGWSEYSLRGGGMWNGEIGKLHSDGKERLYMRGDNSGIIRELYYDGTNWGYNDIEIIDNITKASHVIGCARNDDTMRLYFAEGYIGAHRIFEVTSTNPYVIDTVGIEEREITNDELQMTEIQICPNPFVQKTVIEFMSLGVNELKNQKIKIYDLGGRVIRTFSIPKPQSFKITWDARDEKGNKVKPGIYFVKLKDRRRTLFRKLILLKRR